MASTLAIVTLGIAMTAVILAFMALFKSTLVDAQTDGLRQRLEHLERQQWGATCPPPPQTRQDPGRTIREGGTSPIH